MPRARPAAPLLGVCLGFLLWAPRAICAGVDDFARVLEAAAFSLLRRLLKDGWEGLGDRRVVGVDRGNLRARPSTQSKVVTVVTQGQALVALGGSGDWLQVGLVGTDIIAWVHKSLIKVP